jgi:hypothetical protein
MGKEKESKLQDQFRELDVAKVMTINIIRTQVPQWLSKMTGKEMGHNSTAISDKLEKTIVEVVQFQKKSKRLKSLELKSRKRHLRQDINTMLHRIVTEIPKESDAINYEIKTLAINLDLPSHLPFLKKTKFGQYQLEIDNLLDQIYGMDKRGELLKLLRDVSKSEDIFASGQFFSRRMPLYLKFICKERTHFRAAAVEKYLEIYREFSGVYEKNLCVVKCLLHIKKQDAKPNYAEIRQQKFTNTLNYVGGRIPSLRIPYDKDIRDAITHRSYYIDPADKSIVYIKPNKTPVRQKFEEFIPIVNEMICITLCMSLLLMQLARKDWIIIDSTLQLDSSRIK